MCAPAALLTAGLLSGMAAAQEIRKDVLNLEKLFFY